MRILRSVDSAWGHVEAALFFSLGIALTAWFRRRWRAVGRHVQGVDAELSIPFRPAGRSTPVVFAVPVGEGRWRRVAGLLRFRDGLIVNADGVRVHISPSSGTVHDTLYLFRDRADAGVHVASGVMAWVVEHGGLTSVRYLPGRGVGFDQPLEAGSGHSEQREPLSVAPAPSRRWHRASLSRRGAG
jgi:hypothetical protein